MFVQRAVQVVARRGRCDSERAVEPRGEVALVREAGFDGKHAQVQLAVREAFGSQGQPQPQKVLRDRLGRDHPELAREMERRAVDSLRHSGQMPPFRRRAREK
jgi:hypothetical protein